MQRAKRPEPPYRVWFQPRCFDRDISLYRHMTIDANAKGEHLQADWLEEKTHEIKDRYPTMPGVAFYQSTSPDTPELRQLVQHCDRLSGKLWP